MIDEMSSNGNSIESIKFATLATSRMQMAATNTRMTPTTAAATTVPSRRNFTLEFNKNIESLTRLSAQLSNSNATDSSSLVARHILETLASLVTNDYFRLTCHNNLVRCLLAFVVEYISSSVSSSVHS